MYQKPVEPLRWNNDLYKLSESHAKDTGPAGLTGHDDTNGDDLEERVAKVGGTTGSLGENFSYGFSNAKDVILQLLIGSRGQRYNVLSEDFQIMGSYSGPHAKWKTMSGILYSWDFIDSVKDYNLIESNLAKYLSAPIENFPNPPSYLRYS